MSLDATIELLSCDLSCTVLNLEIASQIVGVRQRTSSCTEFSFLSLDKEFGLDM